MSNKTDSKNFTFENFEPKESKNKKIVRKTLRIKRKNGKMTYADIKLFFEKIKKEQKIEAENIAVCGMTEKYLTMKSFEEDELKEWDSESYYEDRAKDTKKFNEFDFIDIIIKNK